MVITKNDYKTICDLIINSKGSLKEKTELTLKMAKKFKEFKNEE